MVAVDSELIPAETIGITGYKILGQVLKMSGENSSFWHFNLKYFQSNKYLKL